MAAVIDYTILFFIYIGWWLIPLVGLFSYRAKLSKHPITCVIYEKRGDDLIHTNDVAGKFTVPTNCYRLKKHKDSIQIPSFDWILQNMHKPTNKLEAFANLLAGRIGTITLFKYGSQQYKPIKVKLADGTFKKKLKPVTDSEGNPVYINVYEPVDVRKSMGKLEFEVIDWDDVNHMTQEVRAIADRRKPVRDFIEKYGNIMGLAIIMVMFIIAVYFSVNLILDAGDVYTSAVKDTTGFSQQPTQAKQPEPSTPSNTDKDLPFFNPVG